MNLVVIDTKSHKTKVFEDKKLIAETQFSRALDIDEIEEFQLSPQLFIKQAIETYEEETNEKV